jgi:F-type H+-transporting ATPase subunit a
MPTFLCMDTLLRFSTQLFAFGEETAHGAAEAAAEHGGGHHGFTFWGLMGFIALTVLVVVVLLAIAKKGFTRRTFTNGPAKLVEQLYFFIENMCLGIIGPHGRKYIPMMMTFWMIIFVSNCLALFLPSAPTADLGFNLGMALIAVGYVQWEGIKTNGFFGHFAHFAGPKLPIALIPITLMIFVIELISEVMKNVSLSLRLFGNIEGGHQAVVAMNELGKAVNIPVGAFLLPVKVLTCVVQALIFTLLTCVYISLVTHHEDHGDEHGHDGHGEAAPAH